MAIKHCKNGHTFEKTSDCPVCPLCSKQEIEEKYGTEFPKISAPAFRAINSLGITKLSQLTKYTEEQLLDLHGFGTKALGILKESLKQKGLSFSHK